MIPKEINTIKNQAFVCPEPNGHYVDPTNCNHYFVCIDGRAVGNVSRHFILQLMTRRNSIINWICLQICPEGLYYDEANNVCNYSELVDCHSQ